LQHFEISFDGEKNKCKKVIFGNFETAFVAVVTGNLRMRMIVQSTLVPSFFSIEACFIVSLHFKLLTGGFTMKTQFFHNMLMR
jgi:hypothetical protein